ncbi:MAG: tetratricopeptide repeat protein [Pseudomonadota bacterium]
MSETPETGRCSDAALSDLLAVIETDEEAGLKDLKGLIDAHPGDPRLHFLRGSLLAGSKRYDDARPAMRQAIELDPDYAIARFQYGFLELSSGHADEAERIWQPLSALDAQDPLRIFAIGLGHLIRDEFSEALVQLENGILHNRENPALNGDMQLIIDEIGRLFGSDPAEGSEPSSSAQALLSQYAARRTRH